MTPDIILSWLAVAAFAAFVVLLWGAVLWALREFCK